MDNKFEYVYWDDVRRDMKYPESDNNQGFTYGVNLLDENYEIIDVQWFKSEEDRDSFISAEDLKEAEYPDEFEAGGKVNRDKKIVKYKDGRNRKLSTWNEGAGYTKDRESFNKSEDWEIPMNERANAKRSKSSGTTKSTNSRGYEYIPNRMLREAEIENKGKTTYIDAANILDGIYVKKGTKYEEGGDMMEKGGKVKNYKYIPNHMIQAMEVERKGKTTEIDGANILDGIYVKGKTKFEEGGSPDIYDFDNKMALINISQISEYAIKLDNIVQEDSNLEEWVKMKLTRVEQNVADVKKSLNGWNKFEDFEDGGRIFKKQLLHIAKYADELMEMIKSGSKLMSWQENKLAVSAEYIDGIYHHLDYKGGNRAADYNKFEAELEYEAGGGVDFPKGVVKHSELIFSGGRSHGYEDVFYILDGKWFELKDKGFIETEETKKAKDWTVAYKSKDGTHWGVETSPYSARYMYSPSLDLLREQNEGEWYGHGSVSDTFDNGGGVGKYLVWYDIYDEQTGKTLDIQAYSLEEAEQIASTIEFENFRDGEEIPYGEFESGGGVGARKSKKQKAIDLLVKNIKYSFVNTDMGSGWKFVLYAPFSTSGYGKDVLEEMKYLDSFDAEDMGIEDWDNLSKKDKDYYYNDWKNDLFDSSFESFKNKVIPKHLYFFEEELQKDEYKNGGNVGRDWIFKSKQKWEQDYDRKREYKEYKKEGWLSNWFKEGGSIVTEKDDEYYVTGISNLRTVINFLKEGGVRPSILLYNEIFYIVDVNEKGIDVINQIDELRNSNEITNIEWANIDDNSWGNNYRGLLIGIGDRDDDYFYFKLTDEERAKYPYNNWMENRANMEDRFRDYEDSLMRNGGGVGVLNGYLNDLNNKPAQDSKGDYLKVNSSRIEKYATGGGVGYGNEIPKQELEFMVGRKLNGWNDDKVVYNGNTYKKCFLKPFYKICNEI